MPNDSSSTKPGEAKVQPLQEVGVTGLKQWGGRVYEEWLRRLTADLGKRTYREMADNDPTIGAFLFAVEMLLRQVTWRTEPFSDDPIHVEQAEFIDSLRADMSHSWEDLIAELTSMLVYGFAPFEIVYKRRQGPMQKDPTRRSRFNDGRIGWRKIPIRAQETVEEWSFDEDGGIRGLVQLPPEGGKTIFLPIEKMLLFRTTSRKNNPEGRSVLRNAFVPWYRKKHVEESEAIGIERDLAGLPIFYVPKEYLDPAAPAETRAILAQYLSIVENLKRDEQAGLVLPSIYDENGNQLLRFELGGTGATRLFDTSAIVARYERQIAGVILADFILLGHEKVGSFALSSDKTSLFAIMIGAWLGDIAAVFNRHGIPRVYELNGWDTSTCARYVPNDLEKPNVEQFIGALERAAAGGWLTPGGEADEAKVRSVIGMPDMVEQTEAKRPKAKPSTPAERIAEDEEEAEDDELT